jgi:hypothetical protein
MFKKPVMVVEKFLLRLRFLRYSMYGDCLKIWEQALAPFIMVLHNNSSKQGGKDRFFYKKHWPEF